jgi:hypothetical protein
LATISAIVWGYFYNAFPKDSYLSETDNEVISIYKATKFSTEAVPWLYNRWMAIKVPIMKQFSKDYVMHKHESLPQEKRSEALTKFILSLSDQQLVTGLAILIASLSNRCRVSLYEFRVVVSLAWFSSTTHQATLRVLQRYLFANKVVRNWRIFAMVCLVIMLVFGLMTQTGSAPQTTALQCGIGNISGGWDSLGPSPEFGNQPDLLSMIIICVQLLFTYGSLVYDLFGKTKGPCQSIAEEIAKCIEI